ncbi:MAG: hypothetical protein DCC50_02700 [Acidobacteria bacterium]|nr:MAG: hypothetical protein DCC50_02700 [Acidobacteriota bacterium]
MAMVGASARAAGLGAAATGATGRLAWWLLEGALDHWSGALTSVAVQESFSLLASAAAAAVAAWATLLLARATLALLDEAVRGRGTVGPGLTGRVAAGLLVAATLGGAQASAVAAAPVPAAVAVVPVPAAVAAASAETPERAEDVPVPGWTPTTSSSGRRASPATSGAASGEVGLVSTTPSASRPSDDRAVVVVHAGDTLWDIAARALGEHATDQDVAEAWPRWYAANRETIGEDPDLLLPGQRLVAPASETGR